MSGLTCAFALVFMAVLLITAQQACKVHFNAGLRHLLHDLHTKRTVAPRLTLWQGFHGCAQLHDLPAYMQYCYTRKHCCSQTSCNHQTAFLTSGHVQPFMCTLQFLSFSPAIKYWVSTFDVNFSRLLLTAT